MNKLPTTLVIDLDEIRQNYRIFVDLVGADCTVSAVVKADSYGLGMAPVAAILHEEGCREFFVATPEEGAELREVVTDSQIFILNGYYKGYEADYAHYDLIPVLNSLEEIERYKTGSCILHFNTGMNRLGLSVDETQKLLEDKTLLDGRNVEYVMSHFACADEADNPMNRQQFAKFTEIAKHFPDVKKSMANSSGAYRSSDYHLDMIRPGMGLYGLNPTPEATNPMCETVSLEGKILQIREAKKGETVGYGATYTFEKDTMLATVALGYADGMLWSLGNKGQLFWKGSALPVRGRVSMDLLTVDLGNIVQNDLPRVGDRLEVIGPHQNADDLAKAAGTIGYEILTALGLRYERIYRYQAEVKTLDSASSISS
ncbi:MAG: alanine racemase [Micavibrio sp.]|nr:MAG: alanine racemase [Micavibrio sp.]